MFGPESLALREKRIFTIQGISGTGSVYMGLALLAKMFPGKKCYIPSISWENHRSILAEVRMPMQTYSYVDASGLRMDIAGMIADLRAAEEGSAVLLHMCAHNPTGMDPTHEMWNEILAVVKERKLFAFFDAAYQGFVSGDPEVDSYPVRLFERSGCEIMVAASFAKNFGLYGQRAGALHVVSASAASIPAIGSQLRSIARCVYSTCPAHGARIVATVLSNPHLNEMWRKECAEMAHRLAGVRAALLQELLDQKVKGDWSHLALQKGMFSFSGIQAEAVRRLKAEHHIYLLENGRISLAGLNSSNIAVFVRALKAILGSNDDSV
jgi:aspartate/tyrosine/aromatic aminotransferase